MDVVSLGHGIAVIGAGIAIGAGGIGIGLVGSKAMEAIARQPDAIKDIRTGMILMAALIEGLAFFGAVIGLLAIFIK
jgi:F-type H+-transporting ATPase subunit c